MKVFVCGGGNVVNKFYYKEAYELGEGLAKIGVAYGQGGLTDRNTIMGESYWGYIDNGGKQIQFIIRERFKNEITPKAENGESKEVVQEFCELVRAQFEWADVIVVMPGGTGTRGELYGHIELQLEKEKHPKIILYNPQLPGKQTYFYDNLILDISTSINEHFIGTDSYVKDIDVVYSVQDILAKIRMEKDRICKRRDKSERKR